MGALARIVAVAVLMRDASGLSGWHSTWHDGPSPSATMVVGLHAKAWTSNYSDDWPSACLIDGMLAKPPGSSCGPCGVEHGRPSSAETLKTIKALQKKHAVDALVFFGELYNDTILRTRSIDRALAKLGPLDQVVIIGSGFDTRPYRSLSSLAHVSTIFEMDLPATLALKRRLVATCGLTPANGNDGVVFLELDLTDPRPFDVLLAHPRFRHGVRTAIIHEHVAEWLTEDANRIWFASLAKVGADERALGGDVSLISMSWRGPGGGSSVLRLCGEHECAKSRLPMSLEGCARWMHDRGWTKRPGLEDIGSQYIEFSEKKGYVFGRMFGYMGVFEPT